jgi:hypothetical protein
VEEEDGEGGEEGWSFWWWALMLLWVGGEPKLLERDEWRELRSNRLLSATAASALVLSSSSEAGLTAGVVVEAEPAEDEMSCSLSGLGSMWRRSVVMVLVELNMLQSDSGGARSGGRRGGGEWRMGWMGWDVEGKNVMYYKVVLFLLTVLGASGMYRLPSAVLEC